MVAAQAGSFADVRDARGRPEVVTIRAGTGTVRVAEAAVVLNRPARRQAGEVTFGGNEKQAEAPGSPLPLRLVVTRVVNESGAVRAEWWPLTNVAAWDADASIRRWYSWRWSIESYHKMLKPACRGLAAGDGRGVPAAAVRSEHGLLAAWHLRRDDTAQAAALRSTLVRLSGRLMKHRVESTASALLAGLERLLAIDDLMQREGLQGVLALARRVLPRLFPDRSG